MALVQGAADHMAEPSCQAPALVNSIFLETGRAHVVTYCLWLLLQGGVRGQ